MTKEYQRKNAVAPDALELAVPDRVSVVMADVAQDMGEGLLVVNMTATYNGNDSQGATPWASVGFVTAEGHWFNRQQGVKVRSALTVPARPPPATRTATLASFLEISIPAHRRCTTSMPAPPLRCDHRQVRPGEGREKIEA